MQQSTDGPVPPKYLRMSIGQDLLGSWELVRETGQIGGRSQIKRDIFSDCDQALSAFDSVRSQFAKRGYTVPANTPTSAPHF